MADGPGAAQALRQLPADAISAGLHLGNAAAQGFGGPMIDGQLVQRTIPETWSQGLHAKLPLLIGATDDEMGFMATKMGSDAARARGEAVFAEPARAAADWACAQGQPVWRYAFSQVPARIGAVAAWAQAMPAICPTCSAPWTCATVPAAVTPSTAVAATLLPRHGWPLPATATLDRWQFLV